MGQGPSVSAENDRIEYAVGTRKGPNPCNEDAHAAILDLDGSTSFFGVYDGHGGANVASYCAKRFHTELLIDGDYQINLDQAIGNTFSSMDEGMENDDDWRALASPPRCDLNLLCCLRTAPGVQGVPYMEGSTACVALIREHEIIVGNVGDTRCVLSRNGQVIEMSTNHMPDDQDESHRIVSAGGHLLNVGGAYRIEGTLHVYRTIGDFRFKSDQDLTPEEQIVTCTPDIRMELITHDTEYLIIASRAFWDIPISNQYAVKTVKQYSRRGCSVASICDLLLNICPHPADDMTLILVHFKPNGRLPPPAPAAPTDMHVPVVG